MSLEKDFLKTVLPTRRHANVGTSYDGLSVCHGVLSKWMDGLIWFLACRLLSSYPTLYCKGIQVFTKIRVCPSGTLSQTPDVENFAVAY